MAPSLSRRLSIDARVRDLEINLARNAQKEQENLKELRKHRATGKRGSQHENRTAIAKSNLGCAHSHESIQHAKTHGDRGCQGLGALSGTGLSMNQRLAALRQNAFRNDGIMQGHREFLNTYDPREETSMDSNGHIGDRAFVTEFHEAHGRQVSKQLHIPSNTSEALDMVARVWNPRQRPSSASSLRPSSAGSIGQRHERYMPVRTPQNEEQADITVTSLVRVPGQPFSRTISRPLSANSISGRCAAIKDNLEKNKELLQANRDDFNLVVRRRKEARDELARTLIPTTSS